MCLCVYVVNLIYNTNKVFKGMIKTKVMKHQWKVILVIAIIGLIVGCKKTAPDSTAQPTNIFTQTLSNIKLSEPVLLSFDVGSNAAVVSWKVLPNSNYTISKVGIYATFYFSQAGNYTVIASTNNQQATYNISITNTVFTDQSDTAFTLQASKLVNVLPNESVSFTANNTGGTNLVWSSSGNVSLANTVANPAIFSLGSGKTGSVTVASSSNFRSRTVWLQDSSLASVGLAAVPFIFSDKLTITPSVVKDGSGNKTMVLTAHTLYNYQSGKDSILSNVDNNSYGYTVNYGGVVTAMVPASIIKPAISTNNINGITVGTHAFLINFGNRTYTGKVTLNASGVFTFSWAGNSDVSIYPLVLQ